MCTCQEEAVTVLCDRKTVSLQDFRDLKYITRCVCEGLRLYPHPPVLIRRASVQDKLPGGVKVILQWLVHCIHSGHHCALLELVLADESLSTFHKSKHPNRTTLLRCASLPVGCKEASAFCIIICVHQVPRKQNVLLSIYNLHRSPSVWEHPTEFIPERFPLEAPVPNENNTNYKWALASFVEHKLVRAE